MIVKNKDHHSADYTDIASYYRPGHADFTFDEKYGFRDYRGGGRSSGRETIGRVAAGAIASKILESLGIEITTYSKSIGNVEIDRIVGAAPAGEEPTRVVSAPRSPAEEVEPFELRREPLEDAEEHTRVLDASTRAAFPGSSADEGTRVIPAPSRRAEPVQEVPDDDLDEDEEDDRDSVAEALIRWVPPITAIVCAAVALCGFVYYQFML